MNNSIEEKLSQLNLVLPPSPKPVGAYVPVVLAGGIGYLSGQVSKDAQGKLLTGKVGKELTLEEGQRAAQWAALNALSILNEHIGFDKIDRLIRLVGYVQTESGFYAIPEVVNGASNLFLSVFGENGRHARSAVGMASLPLNAAVELELTVLLKPDKDR